MPWTPQGVGDVSVGLLACFLGRKLIFAPEKIKINFRGKIIFEYMVSGLLQLGDPKQLIKNHGFTRFRGIFAIQKIFSER